MPNASKKPPSRVKYEMEHPTVSVWGSKKLKDVLDTVKEETGNSYAEIISAGLTGTKELWKKGYEVAKRNYEIWYYCAVCGEKIFVSPDANDHRAMIRYMREHGWRHSKCQQPPLLEALKSLLNYISQCLHLKKSALLPFQDNLPHA